MIMLRKSNYIHFERDAITHPCPNPCVGLTLGHRWKFISVFLDVILCHDLTRCKWSVYLHMGWMHTGEPWGSWMKATIRCTGACVHSSIGRDTIIFYACTMEVWHISSYFVIRTRLKDDIWPHLTLFRLFCDPDRGQDDIWPHLTQFNTSRDRGQVENCAIEPCLTSLTHLKRHEW